MPIDGGILEGLAIAGATTEAAAGTSVAVGAGAAAAEGAAVAGTAAAAEGAAAGTAAAGAGAAGAGASAGALGTGLSWSTILAGLGAAGSLIGSLFSAQGQANAGEQQQVAQETNAAVETQRASIVTDQAIAQATTDRALSKRRIGEIMATYGASGVDVGQGSALDVLSDAAAQGELVAQTDLYKGTVQANGFLTQAALDRLAGQQAASAGSDRALGTIVSGVGNAAKNAIPLFGGSSPPPPPGSKPKVEPDRPGGYEY